MKKALLVLGIFLSVLTVMAQDSTKTTKPVKRYGPSPETIARRQKMDKLFSKYSRDHFTIDLLGTNWIYNKNEARMNGLQTKWYSRGINLYFSWDFRFKGSRVSFAPGIGYASTNIYERSKLVEDSAGTHFIPLNYGSDTSVKVNKIALQYVEIPLELRIRSNPDKLGNMWKVAIGVKAGIRVDAHTKEKLTESGDTKVYVTRRFADFSLFRFGPTLRVGYSFFNITAYYGVINLFKPNLGPKVNEFAVGISFNGL